MNGLALLAHSRYILEPIVYDGPDVREEIRRIIGKYMATTVSVRLEGPEVPGEFEVPVGMTVWDAVDGLAEALELIVEWWSDAIIIRAAGIGGPARLL